MAIFIQLFILLPLAGYLISLCIPGKKEGLLSLTSFLSTGLNFACLIIFIGYWLMHGHPTLELRTAALYQTNGYEFFIDLCLDKITVAYLFVGTFITFLVVTYSQYYLHRENGYKRFFNTVLFFYMGYSITVLSGNFETLFMGWETLGISSFLLIAFYRDRYLPVKNAVKVFTVYRLGDLGLMLTLWMSHHLWHENITFLKLNNAQLVHEHLQSHTLIGVFISLMILLTAAGKSAQLPFSSWLPRAMEGPTPSSAIFYGSLSVHLGVFLLIRTYPFWENQFSVRILIAVLGLSTTVITTGIARVQSSIKTQIAYASIAQIGLIFIEMALGFENLALFHFAGNAFLRTYQLLVSPSVVSYLIREQFYNFSPRARSMEDSLPKRIEHAMYILCMKEWNLDSLMYQSFWNPIKWAGRKLDFLTTKRVLFFFIPAYIIGVLCLNVQEHISIYIRGYLPTLFALIGLVMVLKSFAERSKVRMSWLLIVMNHFWVVLAVSFNENFKYDQTLLYLSGIIICGIAGYLCLLRLKYLEGNIDLDQFRGYAYEHPKIAFMFLISCLGLTGFPITTTFIGEDLIFNHIHQNQSTLAFFISLSFIIDGLAIIRIYAKVFLGPHVKSIYEMAYRSS